MIDFMQFLLAIFIVHFLHFFQDLFVGVTRIFIIDKWFDFKLFLTEALKLVIFNINLNIELILFFDISNGVNLLREELNVELTAVHAFCYRKTIHHHVVSN